MNSVRAYMEVAISNSSARVGQAIGRDEDSASATVPPEDVGRTTWLMSLSDDRGRVQTMQDDMQKDVLVVSVRIDGNWIVGRHRITSESFPG